VKTRSEQLTLNVINHYDIWNAVPQTGDISFAEIGQKVGLSESRVRRLLRHAMTYYIFYEPRTGYVAHTATSMVPIKNPLMKPWVAHNTDESARASVRVAEALDKWGDSSLPGQTGFNIAYDLPETENCFTFIENHGEGESKGWMQRRLGEAMQAIASDNTFSAKHLTNSFDWASLGKCTVVDVSMSLHRRHKHKS
jgi:6-hydroxytryprostatin B O-methyltransferase